MASDNPVELCVDDMTQCPICQDDFTDPRSPPCLHTFCLKCLKGFCGDRGPGEKVKCPLCRKEFVITDGGIESIQKNFSIQSLVTARKEAADKRKKEVNTDKSNGQLTGDTVSSVQQPRQHTADQYDSVMEPESTFKSVLRKNYDLLSRCLVVSPGLLFKLKCVDYIGDKVAKIHQQTTTDQKVAELLSILNEVPASQQQSVYDTLLSALRQDGQEHVANIFRPESDSHPMSDKHYQLLLDVSGELKRQITPTSELLDILVRVGVLNKGDKELVLSKSDYSVMSSELLTILQRKADSAFDSFIDALKATEQLRAVYILTGEGDDNKFRPMSPEHYQLLVTKRKELLYFIDPTSELLCELTEGGVLSEKDLDSVRSKTGYNDMSMELVNILRRKSDSAFDKFIEALNNTEQQHVVYILTGQGESPLSRIRRSVLRKARDKLVSRVDALHTSLQAKLISSGVLTDVDKQRIEAHKVNEDRTAELIDVIARKSQVSYDKFLQALKNSGHKAVAEELEGLEVEGLINCTFRANVSPEVKNEIIKLVTTTMQEALFRGKEPGAKELTDLLEQNGFAISEITEGSIHISFRCFTEESLVNLKRLYTDKTLDKLFTQVFCPQFTQQLESLTLNITDDEFHKCAKMFRRMVCFVKYFETTSMSRKHVKQLVYKRTMKQIDKTQLFSASKQLKQLVYNRTCRQVNKMELMSCGLKQLVYSRQHDDMMEVNAVSEHQKYLGSQCTTTCQTIIDKKQLLYSRQPKMIESELTVLPMHRRGQYLLHGQYITMIHSLPYELHEMLLKRSCCLFAKTLLKTDARPDIQLFNTLSSVCRYFHFVLTVRRRRSVKTLTRQQLTVVCRLNRLRPLLLATIVGERLPVRGLCTLNNKLYVTHYRTPTISVYNTSHQLYTLQHHIQTTLSYINDIASCSINNCIYVAGVDTERGSVVDTLTKVERCLQWQQLVGDVVSISVTSDGRVVPLIGTDVQGSEDNYTWRGVVEVYNSTGVKLSSFNLPHDIINPFRVVQTANKSFIVCHGDHNTELHRVCEVNNEGFIVMSHGGNPGSGLGQLDMPTDIALDSEERVIVADSINRRILLLDKKLNTQRVLLKWSRCLRHDDAPRRLLHEANTGRLFIGWRKGIVEIYSI